MPSKKTKTAAAVGAALPAIPKELIDQIVTGPMSAQAVNAASMAFKKALIERALGAELSHHLGYTPGSAKPEEATNHRNGASGKTVLTDDGPLRVEVPRDRDGSFEPLLIPKHERRFTGFDDKIVAMYARGMTMREIQGFLVEQYGVEVSPEFISSVTEAVMAEVTAWQARPLELIYPVVFFDALRVKIREDAVVRNKAVYLALGVLPDGTRDILGLWIEGTEGAKFWMKVFNDLKTRGVADILIAVTDGLKGMGEALAVVYPATTLQTCIVHLIRNSLDYASWKDRKALAAAIKPIYTAPSAEAAQAELDAFERGPWGQKFPTVVASWRRAWSNVIPFFAFPPAVRKVIYTTNAIESINARLRKIIKTRGHFPSDDAATKLIWLALRNITADWGSAAHGVCRNRNSTARRSGRSIPKRTARGVRAHRRSPHTASVSLRTDQPNAAGKAQVCSSDQARSSLRSCSCFNWEPPRARNASDHTLPIGYAPLGWRRRYPDAVSVGSNRNKARAALTRIAQAAELYLRDHDRPQGGREPAIRAPRALCQGQSLFVPACSHGRRSRQRLVEIARRVERRQLQRTICGRVHGGSALALEGVHRALEEPGQRLVRIDLERPRVALSGRIEILEQDAVHEAVDRQGQRALRIAVERCLRLVVGERSLALQVA